MLYDIVVSCVMPDCTVILCSTELCCTAPYSSAYVVLYQIAVYCTTAPLLTAELCPEKPVLS
jgi:hypothetical protein